MATFTDNERRVSKEFATLKKAFNLIKLLTLITNRTFQKYLWV